MSDLWPSAIDLYFAIARRHFDIDKLTLADLNFDLAVPAAILPEGPAGLHNPAEETPE